MTDVNAIKVVTPDMLNAYVVKEQFHVFEGTTLTVCLLTLKNGFTVLGKSACADPTKFDKDVGEMYARQDALRQIWPLMGYALCNVLSGENGLL